MVRIPVTKREDGRLEAEGVLFDPPQYGSGWIGSAATDTIFGVIFRRLPPPANAQEAEERRFFFSVRPDTLALKTCDDCGALYLDARSNRYRTKRRCRTCFARQRYRTMQRVRLRRRKPKELIACAWCGAPLAGRSDRKFCSIKCRVTAYRTRRKGRAP
jgi:hypothetical protein